MPVRRSQQSQPAAQQNHSQPDVPEQERLVEQAEERILEQVFSIGLHHLLPLRILRPREHPKHVAPPSAVVRRVRIALLIAEAMVLAVHGDPGDGRTFSGQGSQQTEQAADPRKRLKTAVGQEAMVAQANPQAASDPGKNAKRHRPTQVKQNGAASAPRCKTAIQPITGQSSPLDQTRIISRSAAMFVLGRTTRPGPSSDFRFVFIVRRRASIVAIDRRLHHVVRILHHKLVSIGCQNSLMTTSIVINRLRAVKRQ